MVTRRLSNVAEVTSSTSTELDKGGEETEVMFGLVRMKGINLREGLLWAANEVKLERNGG